MPDDPSYRMYLEEKFKGVHTSINAQFSAQNQQLDSIENHLKKLNGRVGELEDKSNKGAEIVKEFRSFKQRFVWCGKHWYLLLLGGVLFVILIVGLYEIGMIREAIGFLVKKV